MVLRFPLNSTVQSVLRPLLLYLIPHNLGCIGREEHGYSVDGVLWPERLSGHG